MDTMPIVLGGILLLLAGGAIVPTGRIRSRT
jgi:hypothetical protein